MMYSAEESSPVYHYESCCVCDEDFSSDSELANHLLDHADDEEFRISLQELEQKISTPVKSQNAGPEYKRTSLVQGKSQPLKRTFAQRSGSPEVLTISDDSDDEAKKNDKEPKLSTTPNAPVSAPTATPYNCQACKLVFSDIKQYKEHLLTHDKSRPYVCQICNKKFAYKGTLRQHLHLHIAEKSHECKICHKKFSMKRMLRQHEEQHHMLQTPVTNSGT
ncbi:hypothetical protein JTE90_000622 [Oedothorax gibbosus]|uniref:C2H2-type domain-containing protein n=1 Tax=Oedothorax gibbosus TaxID=931172 RepID=A0AAV6VUX9_9ARAC|nr:hypothetical protein JTE90_000622 [Oedothorax gibbosus]